MNENKERERLWPAIFGVLWVLVNFAAYHYFNTGYYQEKISTFLAFFLRAWS